MITCSICGLQAPDNTGAVCCHCYENTLRENQRTNHMAECLGCGWKYLLVDGFCFGCMVTESDDKHSLTQRLRTANRNSVLWTEDINREVQAHNFTRHELENKFQECDQIKRELAELKQSKEKSGIAWKLLKQQVKALEEKRDTAVAIAIGYQTQRDEAIKARDQVIRERDARSDTQVEPIECGARECELVHLLELERLAHKITQRKANEATQAVFRCGEVVMELRKEHKASLEEARQLAINYYCDIKPMVGDYRWQKEYAPDAEDYDWLNRAVK